MCITKVHKYIPLILLFYHCKLLFTQNSQTEFQWKIYCKLRTKRSYLKFLLLTEMSHQPFYMFVLNLKYRAFRLILNRRSRNCTRINNEKLGIFRRVECHTYFVSTAAEALQFRYNLCWNIVLSSGYVLIIYVPGTLDEEEI